MNIVTRRTPIFFDLIEFINGLFSAVTVKPENIEACTALNQCMIALKEMAVSHELLLELYH